MKSYSPQPNISIHALREEGDFSYYDPMLANLGISIHALREEGDKCSHNKRDGTKKFLSTPSARRATQPTPTKQRYIRYFYPRPPRGGRPSAKQYHAAKS